MWKDRNTKEKGQSAANRVRFLRPGLLRFTGFRTGWTFRLGAPALLFMTFLSTGCRQDMHDQPKYKPLRPSPFFKDGQSERPLVDGVVPRGYLRADAHLYTGKRGGRQALAVGTPSNNPVQGNADVPAGTPDPTVVSTFPFPVTVAGVQRGQERFNIFCSPCHGRLGNGDGMVVRRGFRQPPSFHSDRLREAPVGHFFDVMTNGFGAMPNYADKLTPEDRWAVAAYIRALQLSQQATVADVAPEARTKLGIK